MDRKQEYLEEAASNNEYTLADLEETEEKLRSAIQSRLNKHWKKSRLRGGEDYWLYEDSDGVWLSFNDYELREELRKTKTECDDVLLKVVAFAYLNQFQHGGRTIAVPGAIARYHKSDLWYPIYVPFPDGWQDGEWHSHQRLQELVSRYEMSPAEALDYWAVERHNEDAISWGGKRNVQDEAVRKNVRQAREKLRDKDLGAAHEKEQIQVVRTEDVPSDSVHDTENDLFYIPTEEQADEISIE